MKGLISVVVPIYNVSSLLREALDSLLNQSHEELDIILVNDGSIDDSLEIIEEYAKRDDRIRVINKKNTGYGSAVNSGFKQVKGEYFIIFEPDDILPKQAYECLLKNIRDDLEMDMVKGSFFKISSEGEIIDKIILKNRVFLNDEAEQALDLGVTTWAGIYRVSFLKKNNIQHVETPGASFQDFDFHIKTILMAKKMKVISDIVYNHRIHESQSISSEENIDAIFDVIDSNKKFLEKNSIKIPVYTYLINISYHYNRLYEIHKRQYIKKVKPLLIEIFSSVSNEVLVALSRDGYLDSIKQMLARNSMNIQPHEEIKNPKVSVVFSVYNTSPYLYMFMDSLINQDFEEMEMIAIDDGSSDHSLDIIKEYQLKDKRIRYFKNNKNLGSFYSRGRGVKRARAPYIIFLDSDDFIMKSYVSKLYTAIIKEKVDIVKTSAIMLNVDNTVEFIPCDKNIGRLTPDKLIDSIWVVVSLCFSIYKKELFKEIIQFFDEDTRVNVSEDFFMNICMVSLLSPRVYSFDYYGYCYVRRDDSIHPTKIWKGKELLEKVKGNNDVIVYYRKWLIGNNLLVEYQKNLSSFINILHDGTGWKGDLSSLSREDVELIKRECSYMSPIFDKQAENKKMYVKFKEYIKKIPMFYFLYQKLKRIKRLISS